MYLALSRATKLENIGIEGGFTLDRFTAKIKNHKEMKPRLDKETRLRSIAEKTLQLLSTLLPVIAPCRS
jgi:hypothetical protein